MCPLDEIEDKDYVIKLFACETYRVFRDRLINTQDRKRFSEMAHQIMEKQMSMDWELEDYENVIFGDFEDNKKMYIRLSET